MGNKNKFFFFTQFLFFSNEEWKFENRGRRRKANRFNYYRDLNAYIYVSNTSQERKENEKIRKEINGTKKAVYYEQKKKKKYINESFFFSDIKKAPAKAFNASRCNRFVRAKKNPQRKRIITMRKSCIYRKNNKNKI